LKTKMTQTPKKTTTRKTRETRPRVKLPPNPFIHEILDLVEEQKTKAKKIEILKEYETPALKSIFIWNFDPSVVSLIPEGEVPYNKNDVPVGTDHTSLRREFKQMYHFVKGGNDQLSSLRRESMFIQMLEGLHPDEADILCLVKDGQLNKKYKLTREIVETAYPDIIWGGRS